MFIHGQIVTCNVYLLPMDNLTPSAPVAPDRVSILWCPTRKLLGSNFILSFS